MFLCVCVCVLGESPQLGAKVAGYQYQSILSKYVCVCERVSDR